MGKTAGIPGRAEEIPMSSLTIVALMLLAWFVCARLTVHFVYVER